MGERVTPVMLTAAQKNWAVQEMKIAASLDQVSMFIFGFNISCNNVNVKQKSDNRKLHHINGYVFFFVKHVLLIC